MDDKDILNLKRVNAIFWICVFTIISVFIGIALYKLQSIALPKEIMALIPFAYLT